MYSIYLKTAHLYTFSLCAYIHIFKNVKCAIVPVNLTEKMMKCICQNIRFGQHASILSGLEVNWNSSVSAIAPVRSIFNCFRCQGRGARVKINANFYKQTFNFHIMCANSDQISPFLAQLGQY